MAVDLTKPVLVVDDYNMMIRIMHNLLKQLGFERITMPMTDRLRSQNFAGATTVWSFSTGIWSR